MRNTFVITFLLLGCLAFAQSDSLPDLAGFEQRGLHRLMGDRFAQREKSIGLVAEAQMLRPFAAGIGISRANFVYGEGSGRGSGVTIGALFLPEHNTYAPYISAWRSSNTFIIFGFYAGLRALYYTDGKQGSLAIRPEIGFGMVKLNLHYGLQLYLTDELTHLTRHSLTLSYYLTTLPRKRWKIEDGNR